MPEAPMIAWSTPERGDIIVRQHAQDGIRVFILHSSPGPDQIVFHSQHAALAEAWSVAKASRVRVWLMRGEADFKLVNDFRLR